MDAQLDRYVTDPHARQLLRGLFSAAQWYDDLVDGDTAVTREARYGFLQFALYELPANPFFDANKGILLPIFRKVLADWQLATDIETDARGRGDPDDQRLHVSYEMRNGFFDVASVVVDLLAGNAKRDEFMWQWVPLTRGSQSFESYAQKVTARDRPAKEPYEDSGALTGRMWFCTRILDVTLSHIDLAAMELAILADRKADPDGIERSNVRASGAWHGSDTALHRREPFSRLNEPIFKALWTVGRTMGYAANSTIDITGMWANVLPTGGHNKFHSHPNSLWSGVFYVRADEGAGRIVFSDPRPAACALQAVVEDARDVPRECQPVVKYSARPGRLILFPGFLGHEVEPNEGSSDRISLSFNVSQDVDWNRAGTNEHGRSGTSGHEASS